LLLALAWKAPGGLLRPLTGGQVASLLLMALLPGLAALLIYYRGLSQALASRAALAELAYPATATVLNWALLDARVTAAQLAGFALLWLAILNLERGNE
jgi:drug/metabolite transporter (DMT)-like permease